MGPEQDNERPPQKPHGKTRDTKKIIKLALAALIVLAFGAAAGYIWRNKEVNNLDKLRADEISSLKQKNTNLENDLAKAQKTAVTNSAKTTITTPSATTLENIKDSIKSKNTAALEGYMASSVNVILAATEAYGPQTPVEAIKDLDYLGSATAPWDFGLPAVTLSKYQSGDYKQYFPSNALVGRSANNYVVSFQFDSNSKINGIFMTISADLL